MFENITIAIKSFGKSRKKYMHDAHKVLRKVVVSTSTTKKHLTLQLAKALKMLQKIFHKYRKL